MVFGLAGAAFFLFRFPMPSTAMVSLSGHRLLLVLLFRNSLSVMPWLFKVAIVLDNCNESVERLTTNRKRCLQTLLQRLQNKIPDIDHCKSGNIISLFNRPPGEPSQEILHCYSNGIALFDPREKLKRIPCQSFPFDCPLIKVRSLFLFLSQAKSLTKWIKL